MASEEKFPDRCAILEHVLSTNADMHKLQLSCACRNMVDNLKLASISLANPSYGDPTVILRLGRRCMGRRTSTTDSNCRKRSWLCSSAEKLMRRSITDVPTDHKASWTSSRSNMVGDAPSTTRCSSEGRERLVRISIMTRRTTSSKHFLVTRNRRSRPRHRSFFSSICGTASGTWNSSSRSISNSSMDGESLMIPY